jgi:hypothetical protein
VTFEEFVAARVWCEDLGSKLSDVRWEGEPAGKGYVYLDSLYIEQVQAHWPDAARQQGKWYLLIANMEWIDELPPLEQRLWEFAKSEGYVE